MSRYRTPLRYPGGKQRLAPFIAEVLEANHAVGWNYVEPYAGGAGVAIELLLDDKVATIHLNDSSRHIYAMWKAMLTKPEEFCRRVSRASLTVENWRAHREVVRRPRQHDYLDLGFSTFFLNRCNRSGVLTAGVIGGLAQRGQWGIGARFSRRELIQRIENIALFRRRIHVTNLDAEVFLTTKVNLLPRQTLVYCDPPYYARAERLYLNIYKPDDHARIARVIQKKVRRPWIVSYDDHSHIRDLYKERRLFRYSLSYSAMKSYSGSELIIFSDKLNIPQTSVVSYVAPGLRNLRRTMRTRPGFAGSRHR